MLKFPDWCYSKLPQSKFFWICAWLIWFSTLWYLSSITPKIKDAPQIPHLDKVAHFCYFMAGGFCIANALFLRKNKSSSWKQILIISILIGASAGAIDEYHQTFTPGRTGNSYGDWIADTLGTAAGAYYCLLMWKRLAKNKHSLTA